MTIPHFHSIKSFTIDSFWIGYFFLEVMAKQLLNYSKKLCLNCSTFSLLFQAWNPNGFIGKRPFWEGKPRHVALGDHCNLSDWVAWNWQDIKKWWYFQQSLLAQCTMALAIEIKEKKICKSKWLDFTHFSTNYYFFGLYCCETANI